MSTTRIGGLALFVGGAIILLLSALAEVIGLGSAQAGDVWPIAGTITGATALILGVPFVLIQRKPPNRSQRS